MKGLALSIYHKKLTSEIQFLKSELNFLLKILRNCYSTDIKLESVRAMDTYWKGFEDVIEKLNQLLTKIPKEDFNSEISYTDNTADTEAPLKMFVSLKQIEKEVKAQKNRYYEFMHGYTMHSIKSNV